MISTTPPSAGSTATADLPRKLGLLDSTSIVIGTTIGVGIFIVPAVIARELHSASVILATWLIAGVISFFGALAYAELGAMLPASGGQYVYLREAYGPLAAFVCGWVAFFIIQSGSIATVSVGFGIYLSYLLPGLPAAQTWAPVAIIALFTCINYRGVRAGAWTQNLFTVLKVSGLALLVGAALLSAGPSQLHLEAAPAIPSARDLGMAILACFVAFDGWQYVAFVAGEVREPQRNVPLALALGCGAIILIYLLANVAYMRVLPLAAIAATERPAAAVAEHALGRVGAVLITLTIVLSSAGAANGAILASPRIYFAQARDRLFFSSMAAIHPRFEAPSFAILVQGVWAGILALSGSYETLFSYVLFIMWLFHGMTVFGLILLRRRDPDRPRPYRIWGYPLTPLLFSAFSLWFVVNTFVTQPGPSLAGSLITASGVPLYFLWRRHSRRLLPSNG